MNPVDLTLEISTKLPSFPGSPQPRFITWATNQNNGYNLELLFLSSHSGTHIDAPFHFINKGITIEKIPLHRLITDAILFRIKKGADNKITKKDILEFERKHGPIQPSSTLIFDTGWSKNLAKEHYFTKNPGLSSAAAKYLTIKKINLVGIDSPSIDAGKDKKFSAHHVLLKKGVLILENLCNLKKISKLHFKLLVLPLKLKGATGSPVRAVAL